MRSNWRKEYCIFCALIFVKKSRKFCARDGKDCNDVNINLLCMILDEFAAFRVSYAVVVLFFTHTVFTTRTPSLLQGTMVSTPSPPPFSTRSSHGVAVAPSRTAIISFSVPSARVFRPYNALINQLKMTENGLFSTSESPPEVVPVRVRVRLLPLHDIVDAHGEEATAVPGARRR